MHIKAFLNRKAFFIIFVYLRIFERIIMNIGLIKEVLLDSFIDNIKILPFLFLAFLLMEYIEDRVHDSSGSSLKKAGKLGPLFGSLFGAIPQCGFSAAASNLYAGRVISIGTLIAIYLSTSDEMIPIMISESLPIKMIVMIVVIKIVIGMIAGFAIDFVYCNILKKKVKDVDIHHFCEHEHCECGQGIIKPAIKHTIRIFIFLFVISVVLGFIIETVGLDYASNSILGNIFVEPIIFGIIGLIPNCATSVFITKLFVENAIRIGSMLAGLLVGAGVGILVLFRVNEDKKENLLIVLLLLVIGILAGIGINLCGLF